MKILKYTLLFLTCLNFALAEIDLKLDRGVFNGPQKITWIDETTFAVGKWDGEISLYKCDILNSMSIQQTLLVPSRKGVEMLISINDKVLVSSNDESTICIWESFWKEKGFYPRTLQFPPECGPANSACLCNVDSEHFLVTGHANGYILFWRNFNGSVFLEGKINLQSSEPANDLGLFNIRKILFHDRGYLITGSEDGDICLIDIRSRAIVARERYQQDAQRGINDMELFGNYFCVTNCTTHPDESNLWLFKIENDLIRPLNNTVLSNNRGDSLVNTYSFQIVRVQSGLGSQTDGFIVSTGDGYLWVGAFVGDTIKLHKSFQRSFFGASTLAFHPCGLLVVSDQSTSVYKVTYE